MQSLHTVMVKIAYCREGYNNGKEIIQTADWREVQKTAYHEVGRVYRLLKHKLNILLEAYDRNMDRRARAKRRYVRPTHDLLCSCRLCEPAFTTYWRNMKKI